MDENEAVKYLQSLLNKNLRVHIKDTRIFVGEFQCTDNESNIVLAQAYEYRPPSQKLLEKLTESSDSSDAGAKASMASRFLGLIVVPGRHITRMEIVREEAEETDSSSLSA